MCLCLFVENGNTYQAYVKSRKTQRVESVLCDTYTHNGIKAKETITFKCKQPLVGTYLEIVPSLNKPIKVFEIEHYGMFIYNYFCYCSKFHLNNENLQRLHILNESISGFFKYYILLFLKILWKFKITILYKLLMNPQLYMSKRI